MKKRDFSHEVKGLIFNAIFAVLNLLTVIIFYRNIALTTILLFILAIIALFKWKTKNTLIIFLTGGLFGTVAGIIAVNYGVWNYTVANIFGIPSWLFILLGNAAIFIYRLSIEIKKIKMKL